jgi:Putative transposase DNA-binding domain
MIRGVQLSLQFATATKRAQIQQVMQEHIAAVNRYVQHIWAHGGSLDKATNAAVSGGRLSARHRSTAHYHALGVIRGTLATAKTQHSTMSCPHFKRGVILGATTFTISPGRGSFDYVGQMSVLRAYHPISIPFKSTAVLNKWLAVPGAKLKNGCRLFEDHIVVFVEIPDPVPKPINTGDILGVDLGVNKLLVTSDGQMIGTDMRAMVDRVGRRQPGSKGRRRAAATRFNYINHCTKQLPWARLSVVGVENLKDLTRGSPWKRCRRSKAHRKSIAPWTYRQVLTRIQLLAQENRVHLVSVDPANTSRTCPKCGHCAKENRWGESFHCVRCDHTSDSDLVGAMNVLIRTRATLGSLDSPSAMKAPA